MMKKETFSIVQEMPCRIRKKSLFSFTLYIILIPRLHLPGTLIPQRDTAVFCTHLHTFQATLFLKTCPLYHMQNVLLQIIPQVWSAAQPLIAKLTILSPERQCPAFLCLCPLCCRCGILLSTAANKCDRQNCRCHKRIACSFHVQLFPVCQNLMYKIFF